MYIIGKTGVTGPWVSPEGSKSRENEQFVPCFLFDGRLDSIPEQGKQGGGGAAGAGPGDSLSAVALRGTQVASRGATDKQSYTRNGPKRPTRTSREMVSDREACIVILIIQLFPNSKYSTTARIQSVSNSLPTRPLIPHQSVYTGQ
jgi:hypothetical protein